MIVLSFSLLQGRAAQDEPQLLQFQSEDDALRYLSLSDSMLSHHLVSGDELARTHLLRGNGFMLLGRPVKALQEFREVSLHTQDHALMGEADLSTGNLYFEQKSYARALEFYASSMRSFERGDNRKEMVTVRYKMASIHHRLGNDDMAERLLHKVIEDPFVDGVRKALAHETLGHVHYRTANFDSSRSQFLQANGIYAENGMFDAQLDNFERIMQTYLDQGRPADARATAEQASALALDSGSQHRNTLFLIRLAGFFADAGDFRQAVYYQELALGYSDDVSAAESVRIYGTLAIYYAKIDRDADALLAFHEADFIARASGLEVAREDIARKEAAFFRQRSRFEEAFNSMSRADSLQKVNLTTYYEEARKDLSRNKFSQENYLRTDGDLRTTLEHRQMANMRNTVIIGIIFFTIIILLLLREFSQKRKLSRVLEWKVYKRTRELRKANKELNTYIYKSSHDLRTPLTSIKSLLRLLDKEEHYASTKKYLGLIESCTEQMDDILINLSRAVDYKKVDVKVEQIDFNKLRYQIHEKELAHVKDIKVIWDIQEAGVFFSDFKLLKVILQQTITNSIAYRKGETNDYCIIKIYTEPSGARISIEDNGQGISEKVRDKVFDMFVKGTHKSTGAGLGLYLVRIAADKIRAKVKLESEENQGCRLTFNLPNLN